MTVAFIFPGQGSQAVGMGKEFYDSFSIAKETYQEVDEALNYNLSRVIFNGPIEELSMTQNTQPALMVTSIAILRVILQQSGQNLSDLCSYVAGHSLGEYSAACAAQVFSLVDTAKLVNLRGASMQECVPLGKGGMAALLGMEDMEVDKLVAEASKVGICEIANDNSPGQVVISGEVAAIDHAITYAQGINKKAVKLTVSAPFHCSMMKPVERIMQDAFSKTKHNHPIVPLISNVNARLENDSNKILENLVKQVSATVKWRSSIESLKSIGVDKFIEIGAGKVLSGLNKRIDRDLNSCSIGTLSDMDNIVAQLIF
jgi:[acyl-carrier-protein] S-malonyltransferase